MAQRLCFEERVRIEAMAQAGVSAAVAARRLGRHPVTVQRELRRNKGPGGYDAGTAQAGSCARAGRPKAPKLAADAELAAAVCERLAMRWSPQAISADLRAQGLFVCAETIYRACYDRTGRRGLAERSWAHLPRQHRRRKPRGRTEQAKRSALGEFRPLAERPAKAAGREETGHWEGDLIIAKANRTAVATLVERASRHTLVVPLPGGYSAPATARAVTAALARQPSHMVKTLTWDQGREMARWADIEKTSPSPCTSASPDPPGNARPTSKPTDSCDAGSPKAPTSTSARYASPSSKTTSTPCPDASTTGTQPKPPTLPSAATTGGACQGMHDTGVVVNIWSVAATTGQGSNVAYCASKAALDSMTRSLGRALAPSIRVVSVSPEWVLGEYAERMPPEVLEAQSEATPLRSLTTADDVAAAVSAVVGDLPLPNGTPP